MIRKKLLNMLVVGVISSGCTIIGNTLVKTSPPADHQITPVFLLLGDASGMRSETAANLVLSDRSNQIIFAREADSGFSKLGLIPNSSDLQREYLIKLGVPESKITYLKDCNVASTLDEARCLQTYIKTQGTIRDIYLVTSWFHTSRASWLFSRVLPDTRLHPVAAISPESNPSSWWRQEESFLQVFNEYLKWGYWIGRSLVGEV